MRKCKTLTLSFEHFHRRTTCFWKIKIQFSSPIWQKSCIWWLLDASPLICPSALISRRSPFQNEVLILSTSNSFGLFPFVWARFFAFVRRYPYCLFSFKIISNRLREYLRFLIDCSSPSSYNAWDTCAMAILWAVRSKLMSRPLPNLSFSTLYCERSWKRTGLRRY
jgi:hypothetical protein